MSRFSFNLDVNGAKRAVGGRTAVASMAFGVLTALAMFARPALPDVPKVHVKFDQAWDLDGHPVSRHQWLERALPEEGGGLTFDIGMAKLPRHRQRFGQ